MAVMPVVQEIQYHYEDRVTAFVDILGWRSLVEKDEDRARDIANVLLRTYSNGFAAAEAELAERGFGGQSSVRKTLFSDCFVISSFMAEREQLLRIVQEVVRTLLLSKLSARGAVTFGKLIHQPNGLVVGPALVRAYELESREADYGRVLLDKPGPNEPRWSVAGYEMVDHRGALVLPPMRGSPNWQLELEIVREQIRINTGAAQRKWCELARFFSMSFDNWDAHRTDETAKAFRRAALAWSIESYLPAAP